jgi:hypothetical protein
MKNFPLALAAGLIASTLAGCDSSNAVSVPKAPHGGVLFTIPEGKNLEIVREDIPGTPAKVKFVAYYLDARLNALSGAPTTATFQPKTPPDAAVVELKPAADGSGLASPEMNDDGEIAGVMTATIDGKPTPVEIRVR